MGFTQEQQRAIDAQGKTIVSASAGSGKTTVMIEKIIRFIQGGGDVGEILAVTFTKKAASQMKEKLRKALIAAINDPQTDAKRKKTLKQQLDGVGAADISTIHSFCSKLLRTHFYEAGVDNAFRVINDEDAEGTAMKSAAIDELFEEAYENKEEEFLHLLSAYWRKKSDNALRDILLSAYKQLRNRADYEEYLKRSGNYTEDTFDAVCADLLALLKEKAAYYLHFVEDERRYFDGEGYAAASSLCAQLDDMLQSVLAAPDYFAACALQKEKFVSIRKNKNDGEQKRAHLEKLAAIRDKIKDIYDDELASVKSRQEELENFLCSAKTARALAAYLLRFDRMFSQRKAERGVLDYNDLEHKALALLQKEGVAAQVREKYRQVFVDEYQDVNPVQEELISRIGGENVFLVGDVKQSIYGFRGSKSAFFVQKQKQFERDGDNSLVMKRNFRSSDKVLKAINDQFCLAMTGDTCSVHYAADSYMERGGRYPENGGKVLLHFLPEEEKKEKTVRDVYSVMEHARGEQREERVQAKVIRQIIETELAETWYDADSDTHKRVNYADIAILSRKKQGQIAQTVAALAAEGIPVTSVAAVNICDYAEIKTLIDILSLIDNVQQDVPLASALLSAVGDLTLDELASIRLAYKGETYFRGACEKYAAEKDEIIAHKLRRFLARLQEYRALSSVLSAGELLTKIITDTRMETRLLSQANGGACLKRIHRFIEETSAEEPLTVHAFLKRLRDLDYTIPFNENGGDNSVKVLTMHSSKGLEYPVVIVDNLNAPFKGADREECLLEERYGIAPRAFDSNKMLKRETLLRRLHEEKQTQASTLDELNLYYVALTRAKDKLHMVAKKRSAFADVKYAKSFADFTDFSVWESNAVYDDLLDLPKLMGKRVGFQPDENRARRVMQAFSWEYGYKGYENFRAKSSATQLIGEIDLSEFSFEDPVEEGTSKEKGTAYHAFLEYLDFTALWVKNVDLATLIDKTLNAMQTDGLDVSLLDKDRLEDILANPVFQSLQGSALYKEREFLVELPIRDTFAKFKEEFAHLQGDETLIFQGAIDLLAVKGNKAYIVDYKYSQLGADALKAKYTPQLALYRMATAKILGIPQGNIRCAIVNILRGFQVDIP
ncbi:MAG: UvrD-helicase domain-containing protein [Clostridia bacterium]|nr:UvrD-helicase domain-containing protein [Clostridia bacterium]